jgi:phosphopantothenoylcysteine decarboxylase/phosphopantothenate--cysteine ligase
MGAALARSALFAGAEVCVVTGPARVSPPAGCRILNVNTTLEMKNALEAEFDNCDICIMAAAVSDFTPKEVVAGKKHRENSDTWNIECVANPDIAKALGAKKTQQFLVGFSLEADGADESGRTIAKMRTKNCDMMVANTVEASLETKTTSLTIFTNSKDPETVSSVDKTDAAEKIISRIAQAAKSGDSHV